MTYTRIKKINIYINEIKYKKIFILNIFKHCWWIEAKKEKKKTKKNNNFFEIKKIEEEAEIQKKK